MLARPFFGVVLEIADRGSAPGRENPSYKKKTQLDVLHPSMETTLRTAAEHRMRLEQVVCFPPETMATFRTEKHSISTVESRVDAAMRPKRTRAVAARLPVCFVLRPDAAAAAKAKQEGIRKETFSIPPRRNYCYTMLPARVLTLVYLYRTSWLAPSSPKALDVDGHSVFGDCPVSKALRH